MSPPLAFAALVLSQVPVTVTVDETKVIQTVNEDFVCVGMDWWPENKCNYGVCPWGNASIINANLSDERIIKATKMLDRPIIRIGGTQGDTIVYRVGHPEPPCPGFNPGPGTNSSTFTGGCLTMERWGEIYEFTQATGAKLAFGLNANYRRHESPTDDWNATNALDLMKYTVAKGWDHIYAYEYGNELPYNASFFAKGIHQVHDAIVEAYAGSGIAMPKIVAPDSINWFPTFVEELLPLVQDVAYAVSWHEYPLGAGYNNPDLNASVMDPVQHETWIGNAQQGVQISQNLTGGQVKLWMGESGGAFNSGHNGTSNRFMYAFWYLDSLGGFAAAGQDAFCRQAFLGGNYELLDHRTNLPNPDFFGAVLFKRLMGPRVLSASQSNSTLVHAYAQCTPGESRNVTLLVLNFADEQLAVTLPQASSPDRLEYHLTAPDKVLNSTMIALNGQTLNIDSDLTPVVAPSTGPVIMTNQSYAFIIYKGNGVC